jgi:hypothetical protein
VLDDDVAAYGHREAPMLRSPGFGLVDRPRRQEDRAPAVGLDGDDDVPLRPLGAILRIGPLAQ